MTIHPCLFPTLLLAAVSVAAAAALRRAVRKGYPTLLPWLMPWGALCTFPALAFAALCLPPFADTADWLNGEIAGTWIEVLAGTSGVLPGLLWDMIAERLEAKRELPFRLPAAALRAAMLAALLILILLPYRFLFNRRPDAQAGNESVQAVPELPAFPEATGVSSSQDACIPDAEAARIPSPEASGLKD